MSPTGSREELRRDFPIPAPEAWRAEAERLLRGAPFEQKMRTRSPEGLVLEPLYTQDMLQRLGYLDAMPGQSPFVRGDAPREPAWWIASEQEAGSDATADNARLRHELERGLDAVHFHFTDGVTTQLDRRLQGVALDEVPLLLHGGAHADGMRNELEELAAASGVALSRVRGAIGTDPLGEAARIGSAEGLPGSLDELAEHTRWCAQHAPGLRSLWIRGEIFHEAGGHAVQELGMTLAALVQTLRELELRDLDASRLAPRLVLSLGVSGRYFIELAKLRALRLLVARILESCGTAPESGHFFLHARCASRNKSRLDPQVNLLRATTEAFSAAAGGANSIHVDPFDAPHGGGDADARRLARNLQVVLREEARLARVADPAGGSWYVETLTAELAASGWRCFQEIESRGGFLAELRAGRVQQALRESRRAQSERLATRREVRVGTNRYPAPEKVARTPDRAAASDAAGTRDTRRVEFEAVTRYRECAPFEELRDAVEASRGEGRALKVFVVTMGPVGRYMPRLDFTASAFEVGGFEVDRGSGYAQVEEATQAARDSRAGVLVLCGLDESYADWGAELARSLKQACPSAILLLAGLPPEELRGKLESAGIKHWLHLRSELLELLGDLARREGVSW